MTRRSPLNRPAPKGSRRAGHTRITPRIIERINEKIFKARHFKARRPAIPRPKTIPDKRPAMIDRIVQEEIDDNDRK